LTFRTIITAAHARTSKNSIATAVIAAITVGAAFSPILISATANAADDSAKKTTQVNASSVTHLPQSPIAPLDIANAVDNRAENALAVAKITTIQVGDRADTTSLKQATQALSTYKKKSDGRVIKLTETAKKASTDAVKAAVAHDQQVAAAAAAAAAKAAADAAAAAAAQAAANTPDGARANAQSIMASTYGWGGDQFQCLNSLWTKESNWSYTAYNSSGATGIPQALPGSKMASFGTDWDTNATTQIKWGLDYISRSYGTPCAAWSHSQSSNWY
jgi:hypothetical protein